MEDKELQKEFIAYLAKESGAQNEKELEEYIKKIGKEGLQEAYQKFLKQKNKPKMARHGAKLNFITRLNNSCAPDEQVVYYKVGGRFCKKCEQIEKETKETPVEKSKYGTKVVRDFKQMYACGSKMKKKKHQDGGYIEEEKCGAKLTKKVKKQKGGVVESKVPTKTHTIPLTRYDGNGRKTTTYFPDLASRDSVMVNRYKDWEEIPSTKPGNWNKKGIWVPDRTQHPYNQPTKQSVPQKKQIKR